MMAKIDYSARRINGGPFEARISASNGEVSKRFADLAAAIHWVLNVKRVDPERLTVSDAARKAHR